MPTGKIDELVVVVERIDVGPPPCVMLRLATGGKGRLYVLEQGETLTVGINVRPATS